MLYTAIAWYQLNRLFAFNNDPQARRKRAIVTVYGALATLLTMWWTLPSLLAN